MYIYRRALPEDWGFVCRLLKDICALHENLRPDIFRKGGLKFSEEQYVAMLSSEREFVHICTDADGTNVAYLFSSVREVSKSAMRKDRKVLYIDDLCVDASRRGSGAGSGLMRFAEGFAREKGCEAVELNCWSGNTDALEFYRANGYDCQRMIMEKPLNGEGDE